MTVTEAKNWNLIFKYYKKLFLEKDQAKSNSLFKLIRRLQYGGN